MALLSGMRTDATIINDVGVGDTTISEDKVLNPMNYNVNLLLEVLLDIRQFHDALLVKVSEVKTVLDTIEENTSP